MARSRCTKAVGNDVVDLRAAGPVGPRFDARVFAASEASELAALARRAGDRHRERLRWRLWACKEAAFKALKQCHPELVWSPRRFVVAGPRVHHPAGDCRVSVDVRADRVHAIATTGGGLELVSGCERLSGDFDPSVAVRELAGTRLAAVFGRPVDFLRRRRVPGLVLDGAPASASLSFSHHGQLVAFACEAPAGLRSAA